MKETDYTFGTLDGATTGPDNRMQYRLTARARVTLELEASFPGGEHVPCTPGREMVCEIRDISTNGLNLISSEPLSPGALYPATVSLSAQAEPFFLTLEVVWCCADEPDYLAGVRIIESDQTAYVEWVEAVANAMAAP
ncbi:MAG: PilZ domain-containing protein [Marinobacter sp.]|uniref:PilZ domain-containing protein n=1 Tax=Marinobacter sp. TaxID=50741 RepID=UPI003F9A37E8